MGSSALQGIFKYPANVEAFCAHLGLNFFGYFGNFGTLEKNGLKCFEDFVEALGLGFSFNSIYFY